MTRRSSGALVRAIGLLASASAAALGACSGSSQTPAPFVAIRPEDARLAAAAANLAASFGRLLEIEVDAPVLKEHAAELQERLSDALETVARGVEAAREERPDGVARACATVKALRVELDERIREHRAYVVSDTLVLRVPTRAASFATDAAVRAAFLAPE